MCLTKSFKKCILKIHYFKEKIEMNLILSIIYLILTFTLTVLCYKYFGKVGLFIWICLLIVMANIQTIKISDFFGFSLSLGNIVYAGIFLSTDILNQKYGKKSAETSVKLSFIVMIAFTILMYIFLYFIPNAYDTSQNSLEAIFNIMPRIAIASLLAYFTSQFVDIHIFDKLKQKYNKIWLSNNASTIIGQTLDTIIFVSVAFIGILPFNEVIEIIITMLVIKFIITIADTPFMYLANSIKKVKEIE